MSDFAFKTGVLDGTGIEVVNVGGKGAPMTATITSAAGGRKISISTDGVNYYDATPTNTTAAMINFVLPGPAQLVKFTGAAADVWNIR